MGDGPICTEIIFSNTTVRIYLRLNTPSICNALQVMPQTSMSLLWMIWCKRVEHKWNVRRYMYLSEYSIHQSPCFLRTFPHCQMRQVNHAILHFSNNTFLQALTKQGAKKISGYVTHPVFPKESWKRFVNTSGDDIRMENFWITDSLPHAREITQHRPFKLLTIADCIGDTLLGYDLVQ